MFVCRPAHMSTCQLIDGAGLLLKARLFCEALHNQTYESSRIAVLMYKECSQPALQQHRELNTISRQ